MNGLEAIACRLEAIAMKYGPQLVGLGPDETKSHRTRAP